MGMEGASMADGPPAGWMDDPEDPGRERYWDGQAWTEHRRARSTPTEPPPPTDEARVPPPPPDRSHRLPPATPLPSNSALARPPTEGTAKKPTGWRTVGGIFAFLLLLAMCSSLQDGSSSPRPPAAAPERTAQERYIDFIRAEIAGASDRSDGDLVSGGRQMCSNLDRGMTVGEIAQASVILDLDLEEVGMALVGAVNTFCPEHRSVIE